MYVKKGSIIFKDRESKILLAVVTMNLQLAYRMHIRAPRSTFNVRSLSSQYHHCQSQFKLSIVYFISP